MSESFIHEIQIKTTPHDEAVLDVRLAAAQNLYNACLGEALRRLDLMRESKAYQVARKIPKGKPRNEAFNACRLTHHFAEYDLHAFSVKTKNSCWIGDHLDVNTVQKVATRAWKAVEQYAFAKKGRPRFKRKGTYVSVEGKNNASGIRWKDGFVCWSGLKLQPLFDKKDTYGVEAHALSCRVKYLRLVKRIVNGKIRWAVQLLLEGVPHQKIRNNAPDQTVGLDIGPSTIAVVGETDAFLSQFCDEVIQPWRQIKIEQRSQDRSRRANNPDNYKPDGTVIKGSKKWIRSKRYQRRQTKIAEQQRVLAATRKNQHGQMANKIVRLGKNIKTEKLSYVSFQKNFGRSVAVRAPGMFVSLLTRKAGNAGGSVELINTRSTKLSQTCICGSVVKKPLSQRQHSCSVCGTEAQRDLFSAHLARNCQNHILDISQANITWPAAKPLLQQAISRIPQTASRGLLPASFGISRRRSCSPVTDSQTCVEAGDVVSEGSNANCESHGKMQGFAVKPPVLSDMGMV